MSIATRISGLWQKVKASEPPSDERVFKSIWRGRQWRVDDTGIHEFRQGQPYAMVLWADLARFDGRKLSAINGSGFTVVLPADRMTKFVKALYSEWDRRFSERFRANQTWALRRFAWFAFLWLPLVYAAMCIPMYVILPVAARRGMPIAQLHARADRLVLICIVTIIVFWVLYGYRYWKSRKA